MSSEEKQNNNKQGFAGLSFANNKLFYISSLALFGLWLVFCWQGLTTVVEIWYGNEIFNHGFFIVPGAFYLIYLKRYELLSKPIQTSPLALIVIIPALLLYVIGVAGDIQLFLHAATFTLLPALIWLVIGTAAAKTILFPLAFMLFSIPVGEQLIPYLQEIAADGSVALLRLTGVPLFRSGLYIEIPQGRFLVAEACSGVSFFIASFVIGSLYAYLNLISVKRRAVFVIISLIFPILANIVRVYGIILIAYWTDMEHAAGADHLIYGWFFFAFVIVCLLGIGELMRAEQIASNELDTCVYDIKIRCKLVSCVLGLMIACFIWGSWLGNNEPKLPEPDISLHSGISTTMQCRSSSEWQPVLSNPSRIDSFGIVINDGCLTVIHAWYNGVDNELVSSQNRLFSPDMWSRESAKSSHKLKVGKTSMIVTKLVSPSGKKRFVTKWYVINKKIFSSDLKAKLYQIYLVFLGQPVSGSLIFVSSENQEHLPEAISTLYH